MVVGFRVTRSKLLWIAFLLWIFPGIRVSYVGFSSWFDGSMQGADYWVALVWFAASFLFFNHFVFPRVARGNVDYVLSLSGELFPIWQCLRPRSWAIIPLMIALSILLRSVVGVPVSFVAGFYSGLGLSLLLILRYYWPLLECRGRKVIEE